MSFASPLLPIQRGPGADVTVELSWDYLGGNSVVDLDASALVFDEYGTLPDAAFYNQLSCLHGALRHHGDSKACEVIAVDVDALDPNSVSFILFLVNAHTSGAT